MRYLLAIALVLSFSGICKADEPTLPEDPIGGYEIFKSFVERLDPEYEALMSFKNLDFFDGFSGSIYKIEKNSAELIDFRGGYALDKIGYSSIALNLANLGRKYLPRSVNDFFESIPVPFKGKVAKYGRLGGWTGWDFSDDEMDGGITFGVRVPLP